MWRQISTSVQSSTVRQWSFFVRQPWRFLMAFALSPSCRATRRAHAWRCPSSDRCQQERSRHGTNGPSQLHFSHPPTICTPGILGNQNRHGQSSCGTPGGCGAGCGSGSGQGCRGASPAATSYIYMLPLGGAVKKAWGMSDYGLLGSPAGNRAWQCRRAFSVSMPSQ